VVAALAGADAWRWRRLDRDGHGMPRALDERLAPGEAIAYWGSHQAWLLYGRDLRRPVRWCDLERLPSAAAVAAWLRDNGVRWLALGPKWHEFPPERYRLIEDDRERFELVQGDPAVWGMCLYRLR
jgi:hypothetical protein